MGKVSQRIWRICATAGTAGMMAASLTLGVVGALPSLSLHDRDQRGIFWPPVAIASVALVAISQRLPWLTKLFACLLAAYLVWLPSSIYAGESPDLIPFFAVLPWFAGFLFIRARLASAYWWLLIACGFFLHYLALAQAQDHAVYLVGLRHTSALVAEAATATLIAGLVLVAVGRIAQTEHRV